MQTFKVNEHITVTQEKIIKQERAPYVLFDGKEIESIAGYDDNNSIFINGNGGTGILTTIKVPQEQLLIIRKIDNDLNDDTGWGFITWMLAIDGIPVPGYGNIKVSLGGEAEHTVFEDIVVYENSVLTYSAVNNSAFQYLVSGTIAGIFSVRGELWRS